jgi:hypothetical protein
MEKINYFNYIITHINKILKRKFRLYYIIKGI